MYAAKFSSAAAAAARADSEIAKGTETDGVSNCPADLLPFLLRFMVGSGMAGIATLDNKSSSFNGGRTSKSVMAAVLSVSTNRSFSLVAGFDFNLGSSFGGCRPMPGAAVMPIKLSRFSSSSDSSSSNLGSLTWSLIIGLTLSPNMVLSGLFVLYTSAV